MKKKFVEMNKKIVRIHKKNFFKEPVNDLTGSLDNKNSSNG